MRVSGHDFGDRIGLLFGGKMDYKTYRKENVKTLSQFSRTFKPWKKWQNVKLTDICPCNTCEVQKERTDRRYEFMMSAGADEHLVEKCKHCIDHINWNVECIEKLKWYEGGCKNGL